MFILLAIIIGLIIGLIRKGSMRNLFAGRPKLWFLGLIGVLIQIFLHLSFYFSDGLDISLFSTVLNFVSYILILVMLIFNIKNMWAIILAAGTVLCFVVTFVNGGLMPISDGVYNALNGNALAKSISLEINRVYTLMSTGAATLSFLGEYIPIPFIGKITALYGAVPSLSIGEVLIMIGLGGWIQYAMVKTVVKVKEPVNYNPDAEGDDFASMSKKQRKNSLFNDDDDDDGIFADKEFTGAFLNKGDRDLLEEALKEDLEAEKQDTVEEAEVITQVIPEVKAVEFADIPELTDETAAEDTVEADQADDLPTDDDDLSAAKEENESGYFTRSYYAEQAERQEAKKAAESEEEEDENIWDPNSSFFVRSNVGTPVIFEDRDIDDYDETQIPEMDETPVAVHRKEDPYVPNWEKVEKPSRPVQTDPIQFDFTEENAAAEPVKKTKVSEEEMLNVWKQVSDEIKKTKSHRKKVYADDANPFLIARQEIEREAEERRAREEAEKAQEKKREVLAQKWDDYKETYFKEDDEPQKVEDDWEFEKKPEPTVADSKADQVKSAEDEEKERLGFEKVEIEVDGRKISFWQRKK